MRRTILIVLSTVFLFACSLWLGGLAANISFTNPDVFRTLDTVQFGVMGKVLAGAKASILTGAVAAFLVALGELLYRMKSEARNLLFARLVVLTVALSLTVFVLNQMIPRMEVIRVTPDPTDAKWAQFYGMHASMSRISILVLACGVAAIALTAAADISQRRKENGNRTSRRHHERRTSE